MNTAIVILLTVIAGSQLAATAALFTIAKAQQLRAKLQAENNRTIIGKLGEFKDTLDTVASPLIPSAPPRFPLELVEVIKEALLADHSGSAEDIADAIRRTYALSHRSERGKLFEKLDSIRDQIGILRTNDPLKVVFEILEILAQN